MSWKSEVLDLLGLDGKSLIERWTDRALEAVEQAAGSLEGARGRAREAAETARRRTEAGIKEARKRAVSGARSGRDAVSERVEAIARRAGEIRERRLEARAARRRARARARPRRSVPMRLDVRRDDRIVLRGRRPLDLRLPDGGVIRYRYYERPSLARRLYLHLTGRRVWPPR